MHSVAERCNEGLVKIEGRYAVGWWIHLLYWISLASIVYAYAGYPFLILCLARRRAVQPAPVLPQRTSDWPTVAVLISAYNAEHCIRARIENLMQSEYPRDRMTIVIASDGSTDATVRLARESEVANLVVLDFKERRGKAATLIAAIETLDSDIVLFSDATSHFSADAIPNIARHFVDKTVGVVSGRVCMVTEQGQSAEGFYWRLESSVRQAEAKLGIMTGVSGALYAMRRSWFVAPGCPTINDDMVFPILAKHRHHCKSALDQDAISEVIMPNGIRHEFRRRRRIGLGVFQSLPLLCTTLRGSDRMTAFSLLSHKFLRWMVPLALIAMLCCYPVLYQWTLYKVLIALHLLTMMAAGIGLIETPWSHSRHPAVRVCSIAASFYMMNVALLLGFLDWLSLSRKVVWEPTPRPERAMPFPRDGHTVPTSHLSHDPSC